ncbi:hypothetical protein HYV79_03385 [Candidatus Woesearchaeota archaeon]|nr:hypothetical protein [Candidatus Woesearchaeota archaeon]
MKNSEIVKKLLKEGLTKNSVNKLQDFVNHNCQYLYNDPEILRFQHYNPDNNNPLVTIECMCGRTEDLQYDVSTYSTNAFAVVDEMCINCNACLAFPEYFKHIPNRTVEYEGIENPGKKKRYLLEDIIGVSPLPCIIFTPKK